MSETKSRKAIERRRAALFPARCVVAALSAWLCADAWAGAWTEAAGGGQVILSSTATSNNQYFSDNGGKFSGQTYRKIETQLLLAYGITDTLTGLIGPSLLRTSVSGPWGDDYFGMGYTDIGARLRFYHDDENVLSVQVMGRVPGASNANNPAEIGYTGYEYDMRVLYGHNFHLGAWPAFSNMEFGYHLRSGSPPNEYRIDLTVGARPAPGWMLLLQSFSVISAGKGVDVFNVPYSYYKIQPSVVWEFAPRWSLQLGAVTTVAGRNSWREQGVTGSLWYRF